MPSRDSRTSAPLIIRYRPLDFDQVLGNLGVIQKLAAALRKKGRPHGFLFSGPSGVGKTTLARIIGKEIDATVIEVDAGSHSGVDSMRKVVLESGYGSILPEPNRLFIIDECQALSTNAWGPLLKLIEEPPDDVYIALCTTNPEKVPQTLKTRCFPVPLHLLEFEELRGLTSQIAALENWTVQDDVLKSIVLAAKGSPRMALSILEAAHDAHSVAELEPYIPPEPTPRELRSERNMTVVPADDPQVQQLKEALNRLRYLKEKEK